MLRLRAILSNALLHSTPGSPITVAVAHDAQRGGALATAGAELPPGSPVAVVSVADSGPGISAEQASRVFDRFYRVDDGRTRTAGGTGLGLAIAAALAEAHHGCVELRSDSAGGCTVRLLLPRTGPWNA